MRLPLWRLSENNLRAEIMFLLFLAVYLEVSFRFVLSLFVLYAVSWSWSRVDNLASADDSEIFKVSSFLLRFSVTSCLIFTFFCSFFIVFGEFFDIHTVLRFFPFSFHFVLVFFKLADFFFFSLKFVTVMYSWQKFGFSQRRIGSVRPDQPGGTKKL